jgi:hypothetical protein
MAWAEQRPATLEIDWEETKLRNDEEH